ncbi:MAG: STAS domain-containing protein [Sphaerobacter sp.]|nr:STAS domain-containing protein [Sphaerobacter sp.]
MRQLELVTYIHGSHAVVSVRGELDIATADEFREQLCRARREASPFLIVDLSELEFIDSSGLGVLVDLREQAQAHGGRVVLVAPRRTVTKVLHLTGLDRCFAIYPTVEAATTAPDPLSPRIPRPRPASAGS